MILSGICPYAHLRAVGSGVVARTCAKRGQGYGLGGCAVLSDDEIGESAEPLESGPIRA